jgi:hypothetical protein
MKVEHLIFFKFSRAIFNSDDIKECLNTKPIPFLSAGVDTNQELLIERSMLDEMRMEAQKLKSWRKINKVNSDRLVKLLMVLERNIRDVLSDEGTLQVPISNNEVCELDCWFLGKVIICSFV